MDESQPERTQSAARFKDARGKPVTLLDPYELNILRRYDVIPAEPLGKIAQALGSGWPKWQRQLYMACWCLFVWMITVVIVIDLYKGRSFDALYLISWTATLAGLIISGLYVRRSLRRKRMTLVCHVLLKHLRCPHCGYDIRGLPAAPEDGATVCPECGCAWRLEDEAE